MKLEDIGFQSLVAGSGEGRVWIGVIGALERCRRERRRSPSSRVMQIV